MSQSITSGEVLGAGRSALTPAEQAEGYDALEALVRDRGKRLSVPVFQTDAADLGVDPDKGTPVSLYDKFFLANLPAARRKHYDCNACRRFVDRFGGLVTLDAEGAPHTAFWGMANVPEFFQEAVAAVQRHVLKSRVTGVFYSSEKDWGVAANVAGRGSPYEGQRWTHLSCNNAQVFSHPLHNADQSAAERKQDFILLKRTLADLPLSAAREVVRVLRADDLLSRTDKALGTAEWFLALKERLDLAKHSGRYDNLVWLAAATAPAGYVHFNSSGVLGTLFQDVMSGLDFEVIRRRWGEKMHPLKYRRTTAAPSEGQIKQAELNFQKLGSEKALARRFARLEEVVAAHKALWLPPVIAEAKPAEGGLFDVLRQQNKKEVKRVKLPPTEIRLTKFVAEVLPTAARIEGYVPYGDQTLYGLVTAVHEDAPPVLQWDGLAGHPRNPFSWFFHHDSSTAGRWNVTPCTWTEVTAVIRNPPFWHEPTQFAHHPEMVFFVLKDCHETRPTKGGGLFTESLKAEYHSVRSVVEAYVKQAVVAGAAEGTANGFALQAGAKFRFRVKVTDRNGDEREFFIDRWD